MVPFGKRHLIIIFNLYFVRCQRSIDDIWLYFYDSLSFVFQSIENRIIFYLKVCNILPYCDSGSKFYYYEFVDSIECTENHKQIVCKIHSIFSFFFVVAAKKRFDDFHAVTACVHVIRKQNFHNEIAHGQLIFYLIERSAHESDLAVLPQKLLDLNSNRI